MPTACLINYRKENVQQHKTEPPESQYILKDLKGFGFFVN